GPRRRARWRDGGLAARGGGCRPRTPRRRRRGRWCRRARSLRGLLLRLEPEVREGLGDAVVAVVLDRGSDALLERRLRRPAELVDRAARVEQDRVRVVRASLADLDLRIGAGRQ